MINNFFVSLISINFGIMWARLLWKMVNLLDELNSRILARFWIYSHHIKSSIKRKLIVDLCKQLNLNGFMLIGKPGKQSFLRERKKITDIPDKTNKNVLLAKTKILNCVHYGKTSE